MDYGAEKMTERNNSLKRNEGANQLAIYRDSREVKLGITEKNPFSGQGGPGMMDKQTCCFKQCRSFGFFCDGKKNPWRKAAARNGLKIYFLLFCVGGHETSRAFGIFTTRTTKEIAVLKSNQERNVTSHLLL